jgi:hypothetical protein
MRTYTALAQLFVFLTSFVLLPAAIHAAQDTTPQPTLVGAPEIIIDRSTGRGETLLQMRSDKEISVSLSGVFSSTARPGGAKIGFSGAGEKGDGSEIYEFKTNAKTSPVRLVVTGVGEPGDFEIELRDNNAAFGVKVKVRSLPVGIKLDGASPDKAELSLVGGQLATIILKNDDPVAYSIAWRLRVNGREICGDNFTIAPKSVGLLSCRPSVSLGPATIRDLFKNESTDGHLLLLYPQIAAGKTEGVSPLQKFPVKASLNYFSSFTRQIFGYLVIVLVLIMGGLTSLFLSQALPNRLKRLNIREQLQGIARTTTDLSGQVDSRLQVMLRVERRRLDDLLQTRNTVSPDFAGIVTQCNQGIEKLGSRVGLVQQVDLVLNLLSQSRGIPPSRVDEIEALLRKATILLGKTQPTDDDLKTASTAISDASSRVDNINQPDPDFGQKLAQRIADLKSNIETNLKEKATFKRISGLLPGPGNALNSVDPTRTISPASYTSLDLVVEQMTLIQDYVPHFDATVDREASQRLQEREGKLLGYLRAESLDALRLARLLLREMKDDVFPERLKRPAPRQTRPGCYRYGSQGRP